jgi:hypothetical protein
VHARCALALPPQVVLEQLVRCVRQDYEFCLCPDELGQDVIDCLLALRYLDERLISLGVAPSATLVSYASGDEAVDRAANPFPALVRSWIGSQRARFEEYLQRCLAIEDERGWAPVHESVRHSTSVLDLFSLFSSTVDFFGTLDLAWEDCFIQLVETIVEVTV